MTTWQFILAAAGIFIVLGGFTLWLLARNAMKRGEATKEAEQYKGWAEQARKANEIDEDVARLSDDDLDRELRYRP